MESKDILYSAGWNDECYTPKYWVKPILKFLPKDKIIWCPFDKETSEFVVELRGGGGGVLYKAILMIEKIFLSMNQMSGI